MCQNHQASPIELDIHSSECNSARCYSFVTYALTTYFSTPKI